MLSADVREALSKLCSVSSWGESEVRSLDERNALGDTPLHTFCFWGDVQAARTLVEAGADIDAKGDADYTPLMHAVMSRNVDIVAYLLKVGARRDLTNAWGDKPLDLAAKLGAAMSHKHERSAFAEIEKTLKSAAKVVRKK